jgi:hypothetical protein
MKKRNLMKLIRVAGYCLGLTACLLTAHARSQTNTPKYGTISSRFLLIVETSRAMGHRSDATLKTVASLLYSGFSHQIKQGDTVGVWTYNQQLYTGKMALQRWSTPLQHEIVSETLNFFKGQKYEKQPTFSSVRPALDKVIKDSEFITVVLISSGEEAITGTPFDDKINELYKSWKVDQEKTKMPFITVLRAKRGTITGYTAVPAPWQVEIPPWPSDPVAKAAEINPSASSQPSTVPSLIVTGKKPKTAESTDSSETAATVPPSGTAAPAPNTPTIAPVKSAVTEPAHSAPTSEAVSPQQKVEQSTEAPHNPPVPAPTSPKDATTSVPTAKPEITPAALADSSNATNAAPVKSTQESKSSPHDISTAIGTPSSPLSGKLIWFAGLTVLGLACVILMTLTRRPQSEPISLITRSLERESK